MIVSELIKRLQEFPPDKLVCIFDSVFGIQPIEKITLEMEDFNLLKSDTPDVRQVVVLE